MNQAKFLRLGKIFLKVAIVVLYIVGTVFAIAILTGGSPIVGQITGLAGGALAGALLCCSLATIGMCTKVFSRETQPRVFWGSIIFGLVLMGTYLAPMVAIPVGVNDGCRQFRETYGSDWNQFPEEIQASFLDAAYTHSTFFFGFEWKPDYLVARDIVFADHSEDPEKPYSLKFDVYYPKHPGVGQNACVIFIHGGGWILGDKGMGLGKPEYLASQGYVVFDIQYRLLDPALLQKEGLEGGFVGFTSRLGLTGGQIGESGNLIGRHSVADIVFDVGEFTKYLGRTDTYKFGADLSKTIIIGQSAGSHIGGLVGFGYNHPWFAGNFSDALHIHAVVLYYPPNNATKFFWDNHPMYRNTGLMPGSPEEYPEVYYYSTPSNYINATSPSCLLLHGTVDKMVPNENSETILAQMHESGRHCIKIRGYFGGHAHDAASFHNSIGMYFLERFLYREVVQA